MAAYFSIQVQLNHFLVRVPNSHEGTDLWIHITISFCPFHLVCFPFPAFSKQIDTWRRTEKPTQTKQVITQTCQNIDIQPKKEQTNNSNLPAIGATTESTILVLHWPCRISSLVRADDNGVNLCHHVSWMIVMGKDDLKTTAVNEKRIENRHLWKRMVKTNIWSVMLYGS